MDFDAENKENIIAKVQKFIEDGCGCRRGSKSIQCSAKFIVETVLNNLYNCPGTSPLGTGLGCVGKHSNIYGDRRNWRIKKKKPTLQFSVPLSTHL